MRSDEAIKDYEVTSAVDFGALADAELERMVTAGQEILEIYRILTKTGDNVVGELLRGYDTFYEWDHYPKGDVYDRETHAQYYYHAHALDQRFPGEHGHLHTFMRPKGMPEGLAPAEVPDRPVPKDENDELSHLIAISMVPAGLPFRLFTTNRWVTGESWYKAADVCAMLDLFLIDHARPSWPANRWVSAMVRLFKPQIVELIEARDRSVAGWSMTRPLNEVFEDRSLEVASYMDVAVEDQIRQVSQALLARQ